MIRRTPLKRSTKPIARRSRVKAKRSKPRRGPLRDPGYLDFLRSEGKCVACIYDHARRIPSMERAFHIAYANLPCEPMHGPVNGMRSKGPDQEAIPGCRAHHEEQTKIGWPAFEAKYGFSRELEAAAHYKLYQIWKGATGVIE